MARPTWLPTALIPGIRDFVPDFVATFPAYLPKQYTKFGADIYKEFEALGEQAAYFRELLEWLLVTFLPQNDVEAMWLSRHERDYGIINDGGLTDQAITLRQNAIIAKMRNRGTLTEARAQAIWAPVFDVDPSEIAFCFVEVSAVTAEHYLALGDTERLWHKTVHSYSIRAFHSLETAEPNVALGQETANALSQSGERWFFGRSCNFAFGQFGNGFGAGLG